MARLSPSALGLAEPAAGEVVVPFLDPLPDVKKPQIKWHDAVDHWTTPSEQVYEVSHYPKPKDVAAADYKLAFDGLFDRPAALTLEQIRARPKVELTATLECGGNGSNPGFMGAIANATWTGTPLAPLLKECGLKPGRRRGGVLRGGRREGEDPELRRRAAVRPDAAAVGAGPGGHPGLLRDERAAADARPRRAGSAGRPGWYGIAWVKWMNRIEARDRRLMTRFIAKDYVTLRLDERGGKTLASETSVGPLNVKSIVARVTKRPDGTHVVGGAAWTQGKVAKVELKIDDGEWTTAELTEQKGPHTWAFWQHEWKGAKEGEHTLVSRATDEQGRVQPTKDDPEIKNKRTYWEAYAQYPRRVKVG
jgi:DMSO/TMAO reductase YedYZ molybdopterin-dependent catalytic subunit